MPAHLRDVDRADDAERGKGSAPVGRAAFAVQIHLVPGRGTDHLGGD